MSEDIENPNKNLPLAMMLGMGIVIIVNVLLNMSCIGAVGFAELAGSSTPVTDAAKVIFGPLGAIIVTLSLIVLRKKKPDAHRPLKMWGYPITAVLEAADELSK